MWTCDLSNKTIMSGCQTSLSISNSSSNRTSTAKYGFVVYWALNGYGVTLLDLFMNTLMVFLAVWIMIFNALVLDTLVRIKAKKGNREPTDILISSLSAADMISGICLLYSTVYNLANFQIREECLLRMSLLLLCSFSSVLNLAVLTVDRYIKIIAPYRYDSICNIRSVTIMTIATWVVALMLSLLPSFGWKLPVQESMPDDEPLPVCSFFGLMHPDYLRLAIAFFFAPFSVMIIIYAHIFKVAGRHARAIACLESVSTGYERHQSWKYTKTIVIIVGLYFFTWLPLGVVILLSLEGHLSEYSVVEKGNMLIFAIIPAFTNSLVNPIVYAVKISIVRNRFRTIFCKKSSQVDLLTDLALKANLS